MPQEFDITIERRIDKSSTFFYTSDGYVTGAAGYTATHILNEQNIGMQGGANDNDKSLKNYDIKTKEKDLENELKKLGYIS